MGKYLLVHWPVHLCWSTEVRLSDTAHQSTVFYTSAGISTTSAYDLGLGQTGIGIVGTLASWAIRA